MPNADELLKQCIEVAYTLSPYLDIERQSRLNIFVNKTRDMIGKNIPPAQIEEARLLLRFMENEIHEHIGTGLRKKRKGKGNFFGRNRVHQEPIAEQIEYNQATPISVERNAIEQRIRDIDTDINEVVREINETEFNIALFPNFTRFRGIHNDLINLRNNLTDERFNLLQNLHNNYIFPEAEVEISATSPIVEARRGRGLKKSKK